jgi:uncharacterized protein
MYIGGDYAKVLPSLEARHAVMFGKASSCENPVLIRLNDRDAFVACFRAAYPPQVLPNAAGHDARLNPSDDLVRNANAT